MPRASSLKPLDCRSFRRPASGNKRKGIGAVDSERSHGPLQTRPRLAPTPVCRRESVSPCYTNTPGIPTPQQRAQQLPRPKTSGGVAQQISFLIIEHDHGFAEFNSGNAEANRSFEQFSSRDCDFTPESVVNYYGARFRNDI